MQPLAQSQSSIAEVCPWALERDIDYEYTDQWLGLAIDIVRICYQQILEETELDELKSLFVVQTAVYE